jgi:hypothetical protein
LNQIGLLLRRQIESLPRVIQLHHILERGRNPCHGSRFGIDGRVLNGPALVGLKVRRSRSDALDREGKSLSSMTFGAVAQLGEHLLCKQGVTGSIPVRSIGQLQPRQIKTLAGLRLVGSVIGGLDLRGVEYPWKLGR